MHAEPYPAAPVAPRGKAPDLRQAPAPVAAARLAASQALDAATGDFLTDWPKGLVVALAPLDRAASTFGVKLMDVRDDDHVRVVHLSADDWRAVLPCIARYLLLSENPGSEAAASATARACQGEGAKPADAGVAGQCEETKPADAGAESRRHTGHAEN